MSQRARWRLAFLGATAAVLGMEIFASVDGDPDTRPWTDEIVTYVPAEVTAVGIGGLSLWLVVHFAVRYARKAKDARRADPVE